MTECLDVDKDKKITLHDMKEIFKYFKEEEAKGE